MFTVGRNSAELKHGQPKGTAMKRIPCLVAAVCFLLAAPVGLAEVITAAQAAQHVGEVQTVRGVVVSATYAARAKGQPTFLNLDKPFPNEIFTVVIWGSDRGRFTAPPEDSFKGKTVRVTGKITEYRGTPEIIVHDPGQIVVDNAP
jgi:DNA/RNA endonuclease YhcR with UshA esterase domain